jgi:hypothetical protein
MEVYARANERLRQSPELIEDAKQHVAKVISAATKEIDQYTCAAEQILNDNGVGQSVRYGTGPLLVPAEIISPYCGTYLELIMKADRLLSLLEYQRLQLRRLYHQRQLPQGILACGSPSKVGGECGLWLGGRAAVAYLCTDRKRGEH